MTDLASLSIEIFADAADLGSITNLANDATIKGFTTNPTLMRKAGIENYEAFCKEALGIISDRPFCFEVFADDIDEMEQQARLIATWGDQVFVKVPVTNTRGESTGELIKRLSADGIQLNITAILTLSQAEDVIKNLNADVPGIVSVFAGRIADTGCDPVPVMTEAVALLKSHAKTKLLWASTRRLFDLFEADRAGCDIITIPPDILAKLPMIGMDLQALSLETVQMFYDDACESGYQLTIPSKTRSVG